MSDDAETRARKILLHSELTLIEPIIGKTYALYGRITKILDERRESFTVELNNQIILEINLTGDDEAAAETKEKIKRYSFEPGIFTSQITEIDPQCRGKCSQIVFGKSTVSNDLDG